MIVPMAQLKMLDLLTAMKPGLVTENGAEANEE